MENIIFENMVIDAKGAQHGFKLDNCRNIIIRNCEIYNFGRKSAGPKFGANMYYNGGLYDASGNLLYDDTAFRLEKNSNVLIERCYVHDPAYPSQTWLYAHPSGAGCIKVLDCRNTVVRWNDFVGRDERRFIDHIIGPPNGSLRGGFSRDADIYGNLFVFSNDDGAELEGGAMNIRCYGNRIEGTLSGMSTGPIGLGPTYLIGNLFTNPGDDDGSFSMAYKNGGGTKGVNHTRGKYYALNNTVGDNWFGNMEWGISANLTKIISPAARPISKTTSSGLRADSITGSGISSTPTATATCLNASPAESLKMWLWMWKRSKSLLWKNRASLPLSNMPIP
jgi:hypothetical protein